MYHHWKEISAERRNGAGLAHLFEKLLHSEKLLKECSNPFTLMQRAGVCLGQTEDGDYLDFSTSTWSKLTLERQQHYASAYQMWYAQQINMPIEKKFVGQTEMWMCLIPPGKFWMGGAGRRDQSSLAQVEVRYPLLIPDPFWCGKYPVTQQQWKTVMRRNPSLFLEESTTEQKPVEQVDWHECKEFCQREGYQLLSESQWEYATRAGTTSFYFFGEEDSLLEHYGWYDKNAQEQTHSVGEKEKNPWGLYDLYGNVWEWCEDIDNLHQDDETRPSSDSYSGTDRIIRGGCWNNDASICCSANRYGLNPSYRYGILGLRVSRKETS